MQLELGRGSQTRYRSARARATDLPWYALLMIHAAAGGLGRGFELDSESESLIMTYFDSELSLQRS